MHSKVIEILGDSAKPKNEFSLLHYLIIDFLAKIVSWWCRVNLGLSGHANMAVAASDVFRCIAGFGQVITRTQSHELTMWTTKEFERALGWAKLVEQLTLSFSADRMSSYIGQVTDFPPVLRTLNFSEFKSATLCLLKYILHSDYIDTNHRVLQLSIDLCRKMYGSEYLENKILRDRYHVDQVLCESIKALESAEQLFCRQTKFDKIPNCARLFSVEEIPKERDFLLSTLSAFHIDKNCSDTKHDSYPTCIASYLLRSVEKQRLLYPLSMKQIGTDGAFHFCSSELFLGTPNPDLSPVTATEYADASFQFACMYIEELFIMSSRFKFDSMHKQCLKDGYDPNDVHRRVELLKKKSWKLKLLVSCIFS